MGDIKVIQKIEVPLVGPRGGKIPHSLNMMKPSPYAKSPPWAIYKRCKTHYEKHVPYVTDVGLQLPLQDFIRYVQFIRVIPKRGRVMDHDNFVGGMKPLRDVLSGHGWIFDDDPKHLKAWYKQLKTDGDQLLIRVVVGANLTAEYKYRSEEKYQEF